MVRYLDISFPLTAVEKNTISVPFKVIYQTSSKSLELKIAEKYPDLIVHASYNAEQLKRLLQMKSDIKNGLTSSDIDKIHDIFYDKYFLDPFVKNDQVSEIKLTGYDCKVWTDAEAPYLEITGIISSDIDIIFQKLLLKRKFIIKKDFKSFKQTVSLKLRSHLPLMYIFDKPTFLLSHFFHEIFMRQLDKHGTFWNTKIRQSFKIKEFEKAQKEIELLSFNEIRIKILDFGKNLMNKISQNKLETGILGLMALGVIRNRHMYGEAVTPGKTAVITYGRFNPVTKGHKVSFDYLVQLAKKNAADPIIFSSPSEGDEKNPIGFTQKIAILKELMPEYSKYFSNKKFHSFIDIATYIYAQGYKNLIVVIGDDRVKDIKRLVLQYNGVRGKKHGFYKFDSLKAVTSGERKKGVSGTQMRKWASDNDLQHFKAGLAGTPSMAQAKKIMKLVRDNI